jgi:phage minor structural protein
MLRLYDSLHNALNPLLNYEGLCVSEEVSGETEISFNIPKSEASRVKEEYYIRTKDNEFIIKEKANSITDDSVKIVAKINVEELKGTPIEYFETIEKTPQTAIQLALAYCSGGWTVESDIIKKRTLRQSKKSVWDII